MRNLQIINEARNEWGSVLDSKFPELRTKNPDRFDWMCEYALYHSNEEKKRFLNESTYPNYGMTANLSNVNGMGYVQPAAAPNGPNIFYSGSVGSGDKWPTTLPISIQVAARTIGFDIVNVIPMQGPTGVLAYLDYVYAGGKVNGQPDKPQVISIEISGTSAIDTATIGSTWFLTNSTNAGGSYITAVKLQYLGKSRIFGEPIFRVGKTYTAPNQSPYVWSESPNVTITQIFGSVDSSNFYSDVKLIHSDPANGEPNMDPLGDSGADFKSKPKLVTALADHIQGFSGAGTDDTDDWNSQYNGGSDNLPMSRGTGESTYYRTMNMKTITKFIQAETFQVAMDVTTEQIQDMDRQWGLQIMSMAESALINEISQSINKHILGRAFALGWSNNAQLYRSEGKTLNFSVSPTSVPTSKVFKNKLGFNESIAVNAYSKFGDMENLTTMQRRLVSKILFASNIIQQRGRRGPGNFVVTNVNLASQIQDQSNYAIAPMANTLLQDTGALYPVGTTSGLALYVDPNMGIDDNRILVGRKGSEEEPGLKFMPYIMAETISTIVEGTMASKIAVKSRYALVEAGHNPELQYYTFYVDGADIMF